MAFNDGILRQNSFSLGDFKDFETCSFKFFVSHHLGLGKKYEIATGNRAMAMGTLLDESIKLYLKMSDSEKVKDNIPRVVRGAMNKILDVTGKQTGPSFYSTSKEFLDEDLYEETVKVFEEYFDSLNGKIKKSLGEVGFCEWIIKGDPTEGSGQAFKLWGGPDTIEMGEDGIPEVCDYKYMDPTEEKKKNLDFEFTSQIYMFLMLKRLSSLGFEKGRFCIRFWKDGKDRSLEKDFYLADLFDLQPTFKKIIKEIIKTKEFNFCEKKYCNACNHPDREFFKEELKKKNLIPLQKSLNMI